MSINLTGREEGGGKKQEFKKTFFTTCNLFDSENTVCAAAGWLEGCVFFTCS